MGDLRDWDDALHVQDWYDGAYCWVGFMGYCVTRSRSGAVWSNHTFLNLDAW